jgi:IS5 family transposase
MSGASSRDGPKWRHTSTRRWRGAAAGAAAQRTDKNKLYALHAPELACIAKGKALKKYEFGAKVAVTNREGLVVGMQTHAGNPYDGQTLAPVLDQVERLTGTPPALGDRGMPWATPSTRSCAAPATT